MNSIRRLLFLGKGQKSKGNSLRLGLVIFCGMFLFCLIGTLTLPLNVYKSERELKDIPPSLPYQIPDIDTSQLLDISSQITCSIALMSDGTLNQWGQCDPIPREVKDVHITQIATGYAHVLALDINGNVYGWGDNSHQEIANLERYSNIKEIHAFDGVSALITNTQEVVLLGKTDLYQENIPKHLQGHIKDFTFGVHHMGIVSDENEVYILGNQGSDLAQVPQIDTKIKDIQMNHKEVLLLDEEGNLYTWGNKSTIAQPSIPTKVEQIAMSSYTSFALTKNKLYGWGESEHNELSIPEGAYTKLFADSYHMYGIQEDGTLVKWGQDNYILGSDEAGRDMLTRLVHGGMITMGIGLVACLIEAILALVIGVVSGLYGGWIDQLFMRFGEVIAAIPFLPLVITLSAFLGDELSTTMRMVMIMVLLGCLSWVPLARLIRAQVLIEKEKDYVWSAKLIGANTWWILRKEILPQIMGLFLVNITLSYADTMLVEASLSFLGFGVQAPYPSWGNMIEHAQSVYVMEHCWWQWILPALCIILTIWSVNLIGEGLRRKFNPKEEGTS